MRVMVTGGSGFIGSSLVRGLTQTGHDVLNIDALTYAAIEASLSDLEGKSNYALLKADIRDRSAIEEALTDFSPNAVMHLAAESHVDRSIDNPNDFISTNVMGTTNLLDCSKNWFDRQADRIRKDFKFINISTDEVYGSLESQGSFSENSPLKPNSPYAASKASADLFARAWGKTWHFPVITCRSSNNFGPRQFPEKFIPRTIISAIRGKPIEVYGTGKNIRDWIYVEDNVAALVNVLSNGRPGGVYNIGGGNERQNLELAENICEIYDLVSRTEEKSTDLIKFVRDRPGHDFRYSVDTSYIKTELSWEPKTQFLEALRSTVKWYIENESWWAPLLKNVYDGRRLG